MLPASCTHPPTLPPTVQPAPQVIQIQRRARQVNGDGTDA